MSVEISFSVDTAAFSAALQRLIEDYPEAVGQALLRIADRVLQTSDVLVPVRTGFLKSSMGVRQDSNFQVTFYSTAPYAYYVEFGHMTRGHKRFVPAQLFMTRAFQQYQNSFAPEVAGALQQLGDAYFG